MAVFAPLFRGRLLLLTNTLASGTMMAIGDALEQGREVYVQRGTLEEHQYNWSRTRNMLTVGCFQGSLCHAWYSWLDHKLPGKSVRTVARKVFLDCIVASPFLFTTYIFGLGTLDRQSFDKSWKEIKQKFLPYILAGRGIHVCTIPRIYVLLGVPSARISGWMLKIPLFPEEYTLSPALTGKISKGSLHQKHNCAWNFKGSTALTALHQQHSCTQSSRPFQGSMQCNLQPRPAKYWIGLD
uniref:mpv17-like protein 2 isoform X1 n=1 Tax=Myxine glutinosa TaxID=7769 RepID=UPI00358E668E